MAKRKVYISVHVMSRHYSGLQVSSHFELFQLSHATDQIINRWKSISQGSYFGFSYKVYLPLVAFTLLYLIAPTLSKSVNITDGKQLMEYLCSPKRTMPPNTHLVIYSNERFFQLNRSTECLVENTTNISIVAHPSKFQKHAILLCVEEASYGGFSFFNVTNLTIKWVHFSDCEWWSIPATATRYINGSEQFLYYNEAQAALIFNHCTNLTLTNVLGLTNAENISIIGVNLCGWSNITAVIPDEDAKNGYGFLRMTLLVYFTDSAIMPSSSQCNMHIESNFLSGQHYIDILPKLHKNEQQMPVLPYRDFALFLMQEHYIVNVDIIVHPMHYIKEICIGTCGGLNALIMFINALANSQVIFQGYPYTKCTDDSSVPSHPFTRSVQLDIVFYETLSLNDEFNTTVLSPLLIQNTSFMFYDGSTSDGDYWHDNNGCDNLQIWQFSTRHSYEFKFDNIAWCNNSVFLYDTGMTIWHHLLHAQSFFPEKPLYLTMRNVIVHYNTYNSVVNFIGQRNSGCLIQLIESNLNISGTSYFGQNGGGSVINAVSSNITLTGDLTISDGNSYRGGGIRLDTTSFLFLKEPLAAKFYNNSAEQGSAIYAPVHVNIVEEVNGNSLTISAIQVLPNTVYALENVSTINISLTFSNRGLTSSLYAPDFGFTSRQMSPLFLFDAETWDSDSSLYAYTLLIDTIFAGNEVDKFTSLHNGVCIGFRGDQLNCSYIDFSYYFHLSDCYGIDPSFKVYPGRSAFSVTCTDTTYYMETYYQEIEKYAIWPLPCDTNQYEFWSTSISENNLSIVLHFPKSPVTRVPTSLCLMIGNSETSRSIPFAGLMVQSECPFGFTQTEKGECNCSEVLKDNGFMCNIDTQSFVGPRNYWLDIQYHINGENDKSLDAIQLSPHCPPNYCNISTHEFKMFSDSNYYMFCLNDRAGTLCGQCKNNYSAVFGSDVCRICSNLYLLTLPLYALAGLVLVVFLFALRLTVATGTINGIIFYANVLGLSMDVFTHGNTEFHFGALRIVISLLNLDLGFPLCFYNGMTSAAKAGLQFVFPVYLWSIVIVLIISSKFSLKLAELISLSSVQVLATIFYLSFSKIIRTIMYVFSISTVFSLTTLDPIDHHPGNNITYNVWYYAGLYHYGEGFHGFMIFVAAVFIVFFIIPYTILLTIPCYLVRMFKVINKLRPFLDAYGGPFKDRWRFWFGIRLWMLAALLSADGALLGIDADKMMTTHLFMMLIFVMLQAHIRPFQSNIVGLLDVFFLLNYFLMVVFYLLFKQSKFTFLWAYCILLSSAIAVVFLVMLFHFFHNWVYLRKKVFFADMKEKVEAKFRKNEANENDLLINDNEALFEAVERRDEVDTY